MIKQIFALMIVTGSCFAQTTLTDDEVVKLDSIMTWHEQNDSIQGHTRSY